MRRQRQQFRRLPFDFGQQRGQRRADVGDDERTALA
jgi:hypothetical protein